MKGVDLESAAYGFRADLPGGRPSRKTGAGEKKSIFSTLFTSPEEPEGAGDIEARGNLLQHLEGQMDEIHRLGEELARHPGHQTIAQYKKVLRQVLQIWQDKAVQAERQFSTRNVMEQKQYQVIKIIDDKLDRLVAGILQSQYTQLEILSKVEEIQGLLVNLLH